MPVERVSTAAKTYLAAIGAAAIYIATDQGRPVSVGVARDLDKALRHLRKIICPSATFGWVAWGSDYQALTRITQIPDLTYVNGGNGVKTVLPLEGIVQRIDQTARESGIALTQHSLVIERANVYARHVDEAITAMQKAGVLKTFNQTYRKHRLELARKGESAPPYWSVLGDLRAIIVRMLVEQGTKHVSPDLALAEIRKHFPWFTRWRKNGRSTKHQHAIDKAVKIK